MEREESVGQSVLTILTRHSKAPAILMMLSVTWTLVLPGLKSLSAASLARWAAIMTSALRPVTTLSELAPTTTL